MRWSLSMLVAFLALAAVPVGAWTPDALLRGPAAIVNAPLVPFRSAVGGVLAATEDKQTGSTQRRILLPPFLGVAGAAMGLVEGVIWAGTGLADTVTGGALELAPEEATHLSAAPLTPLFLPSARQTRTAAR